MKLLLTEKEIKKSIMIGEKVAVLLSEEVEINDIPEMTIEEIANSMNLKGICKAEVMKNGDLSIEYNEDFTCDVISEYSTLIVSLVGLIKPIIKVFKNFTTNINDIVNKYMDIEE